MSAIRVRALAKIQERIEVLNKRVHKMSVLGLSDTAIQLEQDTLDSLRKQYDKQYKNLSLMLGFSPFLSH